MEKLKEIIRENLDGQFLHATISGKRRKDLPDKVKIRPVRLKDRLYFQTAISDGKKEFHKNYDSEALLGQMENWLLQDYRQLQMDTAQLRIQALVSKKGRASVHTAKMDRPCAEILQEHNRKKKYLLEEGTPVPFLVDLGVMTPEGKIVHAHYHKFRQINRFLEFIQDVLPELPEDRPINILDFGCGKSYLTFAMYYYLHELQGRPVHMVGLDLKEDVIDTCGRLAQKYGYDHLEFCRGDIASYEGDGRADMVVTLHACDTATDYALQKAVEWNARVILAVPCCQHELNRQIRSAQMQPILKYGLIKERLAALLTDAFRANLLEERGYQVQILEFIDMEHTPKNILIRAVRTDKIQKRQRTGLRACMDAWNADPLLWHLLEDKREEQP